MKQLIFFDLHYFCLETVITEIEYLEKYSSNINYIFYLSSEIKPTLIQQVKFDKCFNFKGAHFILHKKNKVPRFISKFMMLMNLRKKNADALMLHGLVKSMDIVITRWILGKPTKIILQNHGERPFKNIFKRWAQKLANTCIDTYLFVSKEQSNIWIEKRVISKEKKVVEVMEGSTTFQFTNQRANKQNGERAEIINLLWVGRLDKNKDPLCALEALYQFKERGGRFKLQMIYSTNDLELEVIKFIGSKNLKTVVELLGEVEHEKLEQFYNRTDYFISASHSEGSGYALCEAMACGCVPIVTNIPSFKAMLDNGECGYLYEPGNPSQLANILCSLKEIDFEIQSKKVMKKFQDDLSFEAIGKKISQTILGLSEI